MTYELAKQLRDAEFPQDKRVFVYVERTKKNHEGEWSINLADAFLKSEAPKTQKWIAAPTLEELIEACGDNFDCLRHLENGWACFSNKNDFPHGNRIEVAGWSSPTEAVARLWIALNKK